MAASIEYTQSFSTTFVSSGLQTPYFWALDAASPNPGSKFIIKSVTVSCPTGFTSSLISSFAPYAILQTSATAGSGGTGVQTVATFNDGIITSSLAIYPLVDATDSIAAAGPSAITQFICSQPCIGVQVNLTNAGATIYLVVTYSVIDGSNALIDNFQSSYSTTSIGNTTTLPVSISNTCILKSTIMSITGSIDAEYNITPITISNPGSTTEGYVYPTQLVSSYQSFCYASPFYISPNSTTTLGFNAALSSGSAGTISTYTSWTENAV